MPLTTQGGVRPQRIEWIAETTEGEVPVDPKWELFSDNVTSWLGWEPEANMQTQRGAGSSNPQGFFNGAETHEISIEYDLQQWYVDGSGNTVDPGGDFLRSSSDNTVNATHSILVREEHAQGGTDNAGRRVYTVVKGAHPDEITVPFETEDGSPIAQELTYQAEKVRQYDISQPSSSTTLDVINNGTTSVDVTIENEGATTSETVTVAGGSSATTTKSFGDIDAVELSTDTDGSVEVTDGAGTTFVTIDGSDSYPAGEGDLGVPALGAGSHASALGTSFIRFIDDDLSIPTSPPGDFEITSGELTVSTGLDDNTKVGTARRNIHSAEFEYTWTFSLAGPQVSVEQTQTFLQETSGTITWTAQEGTITGNNTRISSPGELAEEAGQAKLIMDNEAMSQSLTLSN